MGAMFSYYDDLYCNICHIKFNTINKEHCCVCIANYKKRPDGHCCKCKTYKKAKRMHICRI